MPLSFFQRLGLVSAALAVCLSSTAGFAGNPANVDFSPSSQTVGAGATATFTVTASGDPTLLYQWFFNGTNLPGATSSNLVIPDVQATNGGNYQVVVTNDYGSSTSTVAMLMVRLTPAVTGWTYTGTVAAGGTASFTIFANGQAPLYYQWSFDNSPISGATNSTLTITNAQTNNTGNYQVVITNSLGHFNGPQLGLTVTLPPVVTGTSSSGPVAAGGTASFSVFVTGATPLTFQWYFDTTNLLQDATNSTLYITNAQATNAGDYELFITNVYGWTQSVALPLTILPGQMPTINGDLVDQTVPQSFSATFQFFASGSQPLLYQWFMGGNPIAGATNSTLTFIDTQTTNAGTYQVVVTNDFGSQTSRVATLTVPVVETEAPGVGLATLFSFDAATNGDTPESAVTVGTDGYLYVTALQGGTNDSGDGGDGTVTKLYINGDVAWTVSLSGVTGANPAAGLAQGPDGSFYGTAVHGGGAGYGTVFNITPDGLVTPLYSFTNGADGANPSAGLIFGSDGYLYGDTAKGGVNDTGGPAGDGTVFKMTTNGVLVWATSLDITSGRNPVSGLVQAGDGNFYGTTPSGGLNNLGSGGSGTVFQVTPDGALSLFYSFADDANGGFPEAGLAMGPDGRMYGTTTGGGDLTLNEGLGFGTVFSITTNASLATLTTFNGTNGINPRGTLVLGHDFYFYGTAQQGGAAYPLGFGTVFQVSINGALSNLISFNGNYGGAYPDAGLAQDASGIFYGTTEQGGTNDLATGGDGTLFSFSVPPSPPEIVAVSNQTVQIPVALVFTNQAYTPNGPVTFSLDPSDPTGVYLGADSGVFRWEPACEQGSTTNTVTIWASDNSEPPMSNSITFSVVVGDCVQVSIGSSAVQVGQTTAVPLNLLTTVSLTNLNFSLSTLASRFTNWTLNASNGVIGAASAQETDASMPQFNIGVQDGQALLGESLLGYIFVDTLPGGSAFAPVMVGNIVATTSNNTVDPHVFGNTGRVVLIDGQPLLDAWLTTNGAPMVTLYGNPGSNYIVYSTTDLNPPIDWALVTNLVMTNLFQVLDTGPNTNQVEIFQAIQP